MAVDIKDTKVDIMISCAVDQYSAETGFNLIKILNNLGVETNYTLQQTCCGKTLYNFGDFDGAKNLGEKLMLQFADSKYVVCTSSSCVAYIKKYFSKLFFNSTYHNDFQNFCNKIYDISDFLVNVLNITDVGAFFPHKVVFLDNCHTLNDYGIKEEPRILLKNVSGLTLYEIPSRDICCGFGSTTFANDFECISTEMARRKIEAVNTTGATFITSTDSSCLLHLQSYINKNKLNLKCVHIIDILAKQKI